MTGYSLDLGKRNTGLAVWVDGCLTEVAARTFTKHTYFGDVLTDFRRWFESLLSARPLPGWVAYEEVMVKNKRHAELHFGMVAVLAMACSEHQIPLLGVNTMTMKKQVTGAGSARKEQMVAEVRQRYPMFEIDSDDVADAVAVGIVAQLLFMDKVSANEAGLRRHG